MKKILAAAAALVLLSTTYLVAQSISVPVVSVLNPTTDLIQVIPGGRPQAGNVYASPSQLLTTSFYTKQSPLGGFSYTFANNQSSIILNGAGTATTGTITFPPAPSDGDQVCIFSTPGTVTTLTLSANTGQSVNNAITTIAANTRYCYTYSASNTTWDRS